MSDKENKNSILQFRFSPNAVERLDALKGRGFCSTRAEVVRNALRLYEFLLEKSDEGYKIQMVKGKEKETIILLPS